MTKRLQAIVLFALVGTSGFALTASAQEGNADQQAQGCEALGNLLRDNTDRLREEWVTQAERVVSAGDAQDCTTYHEQATAALQQREQAGQGGEEVSPDARIVVTQEEPSVNVEQMAPMVSVTQQQPQVAVNQGQPEVLIRQAAPTVRVQVPPPTITIEQPQPEIIIRMPDPDVQVSTAEPEVEVRLPEPRVQVEQAEPQVQVQATPESEQETPDVNVQQQEVQVEQRAAEGEPEVEVQRQEPRVQFEAAEPNIQVEPMGEPEIQFNRTGEPQIRVESMEGGSQQGADRTRNEGAGDQQQSQGEQSAQSTQQQAQSDEQQTQSDQQQAQGRQQRENEVRALLQAEDSQQIERGEPQEYYVRDVLGRRVWNADDVDLGTVQRVVQANERFYLVLGPESQLSDGQPVVLPAEHIVYTDNRLILRSLNDEQLAQLQEYDGSQAQEVSADQTVQIESHQ